jgi:hypothetical protein
MMNIIIIILMKHVNKAAQVKWLGMVFEDV